MNILKTWFGKLFTPSQPHPLHRHRLMGAVGDELTTELAEERLSEINALMKDYPNVGWLYQCRVYIKLSTQQFDDQFFDDCEKALALDHPSTRWLTLSSRAMAHLYKQDYEKALLDYTASLNQRTTQPDAIYPSRAYVYELLNRPDDALNDFNTVLKLDHRLSKESKADIYLRRGNLYSTQRKYEEAIADFSEAIRISPDFIKAYIRRGSHYAYLRRYDEAIANSEKVLSLLKDTPDMDKRRISVLGTLAEVHLNTNNFEAAIADCNQILQIDPHRMNILIFRGIAYYGYGDHEKMQADYREIQILQLEKGYQYANRAGLHELTGNFEQAIDDARKAIEIEPDSLYSHLRYASTLFCSKQYDESLQAFEKAVDIKGTPQDYEWAILGQAICHYELGNQTEAHSLWEKAAEKNLNLKKIGAFKKDYLWTQAQIETAQKIMSELYGA